MLSLHGIVRVVLVSIMLIDIASAKTWKDYNLTVGPKKGETGRYIYKQSVGGQVHCHYCEERALRDSTYSFLQQPRCIRHYDGKKIEEEVLPRERKESKYALCVKGEVPGCGRPPDVKKSKNHVWQCDPGYSNVMYSVYFTCALVCNITDKVQWSYYCNESLQWDVEQSIPWQPCQVPVVIEPKDSVTVYIAIGVGIFIALFVTIVVTTCCCYRRRKRTRSDENLQGQNVVHNNAAKPLIRNNGIEEPVQEDSAPKVVAVQITPEASMSEETSGASSYKTNSMDEVQPLLPGGPCGRPTMRDAGTDSISQDEAELVGAVGGELPSNATASDTQQGTQHNKNSSASKFKASPDIRVILMKGSMTQQSIPLQNGYYSIEKGWDFAVVPNSPGGVTIRDFKIERKDEGNPFRGNPHNFWWVVYGASEDDAGLFSWTVRLENNEIYEGSLEISISLPQLPQQMPDYMNPAADDDSDSISDHAAPQDFPAGERMAPVGQENDELHIPSVRNQGNPLYVLQQGNQGNPPYVLQQGNPVNPQNMLQQPVNSVPHLCPSSIFKSHTSTNNSKNINKNIVPVNQTYRVNAEVHPEIPSNTDLFRNTPDLRFSSSFLRSNQQRNTADSGVQTGVRNLSSPNSSRSRKLYPSQINAVNEHDEHDRVRSGNLTSSSGYQSQRSSEIARERFNEHFNGLPDLNPGSFFSENLSNRTRSGITEPENYRHSNGVQDNLQNVRTDPAGGAPQYPFMETPQSFDPNDPEQVHPKEIVESEMQQQLPQNEIAADDGDTDSISERLDSLDLQKSHHHSPEYEDADGDTDSISDRLVSVPIQSPGFAILPQTLDNDHDADSVVGNEDIIPRSEIPNSGESFEINFVNNSANSLDSERLDETKL